MAIRTFGPNAVDWEQRVDLDRLRVERLQRLKDELERSELGALLTFDFANIRYMTSTHIGTWAMDKLIRFALLPRGGEPIVWDFGSAARHHQLYNPWLDGEKRARAGISTLRGAFNPDAGIAEDVARQDRDRARRARPGERTDRRRHRRDAGPRGDAATGPRRRRRPAGVPRGPADQDRRTRSPCSPRRARWSTPPTRSCTGSCARGPGERVRRPRRQDALRPRQRVRRGGQRDLRRTLLARTRTCTATASCVPATRRSSTSCTATWATAPATTAASRSAARRPAMRDAYVRCREYMDEAIALVKPGATTADIASVWPRAEEFGFANEEAAFALQYGHGVGLAIWEKPIFTRLVSLDHPEVLEEGMVFALETYWPARGRLVGGPHRGGARRDRRRVRGDHEVPGRGAARRRQALLDGVRPPRHPARVAVAPQHPGRTRRPARDG